VEHLKGAAPALPANIRIGLKGLLRTNTLAYYGNPQVTAIISFMIQAPDGAMVTIGKYGNNWEIWCRTYTYQ